ncbi:MAG: hypothetical protein WCQ95_13880 [Bacteroidota bacterium]
MKKILATLLSIQILTGAIILPKGDFGLLMQLPKIIDCYKQLNGDVCFGDFFEEEFFDKLTAFNSEKEQNDDPFEKEQKSVPIDVVVSGVYMLCYYTETAVTLIIPITTRTENNTPYIQNYRSTDLKSIFHPPECVC